MVWNIQKFCDSIKVHRIFASGGFCPQTKSYQKRPKSDVCFLSGLHINLFQLFNERTVFFGSHFQN